MVLKRLPCHSTWFKPRIDDCAVIFYQSNLLFFWDIKCLQTTNWLWLQMFIYREMYKFTTSKEKMSHALAKGGLMHPRDALYQPRQRGYLFFRWKIEIYFIERTLSVIFSRVGQPQVKILPMVFTGWNKFRSFTEKNKYSVYFMFLTLSGRSYIKIQYSSFPSFPLAYLSRIATHDNFTSSARNVRLLTSYFHLVVRHA